MKHKILTLIILLLPYLVWADSQVLKLNEKPVPEVVARVNGTTLNSDQLQSEFISFRLRLQAQGKKISPSEETLIARQLLKAEIMKELITQKARSLNIKITPQKSLLNNPLQITFKIHPLQITLKKLLTGTSIAPESL